MDDEVPEIDEDPLGLVLSVGQRPRCGWGALGVPHRIPMLVEDGEKMVLQGVELPRATGGTYHEEIGDGGQGPQVKNTHRLRVLVQRGLGRKERFGVTIDG